MSRKEIAAEVASIYDDYVKGAGNRDVRGAAGIWASDPLTPRERQILQLVAEGKTTKEIAGLLGIRVKTAESHRTRIGKKLDIHLTAGLVRYAIRRGLIQT